MKTLTPNFLIIPLAIALLTPSTAQCYYNASTGRWLSRDPIADVAFLGSYCRDKEDTMVATLATKCLEPCYAFSANSPLSQSDVLGLENVPITVTSIIRPPDPQPGVKTKHIVVVNEYGSITRISKFVGTTDLGIAAPTGTATFSQSAGGTHPVITVHMGIVARSATLPPMLSIRYNLEVQLDFCSRQGQLSGVHEAYPSYNVVVKGNQIYDFQQHSISGLTGFGLINAEADFEF